MLKAVKWLKWSLLVSGVLILLIGISMLFTPMENLVGLALFISIAMLISGICEVIAYFHTDKERRSYWMLISGVLSVIFGFWLIFGQGLPYFVALIPVVFAGWMIASGLLRVISALSNPPANKYNRLWLVGFGALQGLLGFILIWAPWLSAIAVSLILAFMFISYGTNNIFLFLHMNKIGKFFGKAEPPAPSKPVEAEGSVSP